MKQLIQNFKTGKLYLDEVPMPVVASGMVLVENEYSLISAGTERSTVKVAKANLFNKARQRPDLVAQVLQNLRKEGYAATFNKVQTKLNTLKALGYSSAGTVLASLDKAGNYKVGDRVACGGQDFASHSEIVSVPQNLVARIPDNVSSDQAAFTTLGAIALQGVRQADVRLGERVCVIGLGLLGQITCQLLQANGCAVFGIDLSELLVGLAAKHGADKAMNRKDANLTAACENFTDGFGFDAIIITAATSSNDPIELSAELARKKGKVIIVGAVKMDVPRDPHFYRKELDLRMSCSYGPGRYDVGYEELGVDYPLPYVRWTEQRNMQAFLALLSKKTIDLSHLITHVFEIDQAEQAYDIILGNVVEPHIGIVLKYGARTNKFSSLISLRTTPVSRINVGFIGAGSFAQSYLIPNVKASGASLDTVVTSRGITSKNVAEKFGFGSCSAEVNDILKNEQVNTVFIATPHSAHAPQVIESLKAGKNVFVEKPLAIDYEQLQEIAETRKVHDHPIMVGFNRRFAPVCKTLKEEFQGSGDPLVINIRVNAGFIPKDHWTQIPEIGAGRIIGEMCHFIDLMTYFTNAAPIRVFAESIDTANQKQTTGDNVAIVVRFDDGSIGNLTYLANGDKSLPKENIEIFGAGKVGIIHDFKSATLHKGGKAHNLKCSGKGHKEEVEAFLSALQTGNKMPIDFSSLYTTTLTTFKIIDSLQSGLPQDIVPYE